MVESAIDYAANKVAEALVDNTKHQKRIADALYEDCDGQEESVLLGHYDKLNDIESTLSSIGENINELAKTMVDLHRVKRRYDCAYTNIVAHFDPNSSIVTVHPQYDKPELGKSEKLNEHAQLYKLQRLNPGLVAVIAYGNSND